jgi:peptidoglycan hydrolase-like protein with peptidoglycan-binding domain
MTHALRQVADEVEAAFQPEHAPAGSPAGGQFTTTGGGSGTAKPAAKKKTRPGQRRPVQRRDDGTLSYDPSSNQGTGYSNPDGDPRVHRLQEALTRLGLTDGAGKGLKKDGKLGPKTTAAVKKAQKALGLAQDGKVSPALLDKLSSLKSLPRAVKAAGSDLRGVELARPGDWKLSTGDVTFTAQMLQDAADFFSACGGQAVPVKLGHTDSRFNGDGEPAFGSVTNVRYTEDDRGPVLLGDIVDMPEWLGAAAPKRWPNRSIEGWRNFQYDGREYSLVLSGLALLGVTPPGVKNIRSLADLQVALAASSAVRLVASAPLDDPAEPPPDDDEDEDDEELEDEELDEDPPDELPPPTPLSQTPAHPAGVSHVAAQAAARIHNAPVRGAGMDPAKIREALGLTSDASDDEVRTAVAAAGFAPPTPPAGVAASSDPAAAATAARGGLITIDPAQLEQFNAAMVRAAALDERLKKQDRDTTITEAVRVGKFPPARKAHYEKLWDIDPVGCREVIASLAAGLIPVTASGYDTDADDTNFADAEYEHLFPPVRREASRG